MQDILKVFEFNIFQKKLKNSYEKIITANIYRIQAYDLIMCGYFCIGYIDFMLNHRRLTDFTDLFSLNSFETIDETIL